MKRGEITTNKGKYKPYIYKTDIRRFMQCSDEKAGEIFNHIKDYELDTLMYESFVNRVPQDLFHEWRNKRRKVERRNQ